MNGRILIAALSIGLLACESSPTATTEAAVEPSVSIIVRPAALAAEQFTSFFQAIALCPPEIGRIQFSGVIEGTDHTTVDGRDETHRTRAFRVKGLNAVNLDYGTTYNVTGGAEMLTWHTQLGQTPGNAARSLHAGTLVFEPVDGGPRVIAHHAIRFIQTPSGETVLDFHQWTCRTR
jgi:hypothetical protein